MPVEEVKLIMMQVGLTEPFKLHQEEIQHGDRAIKITVLSLDMQELYIFQEVQMLV